VNEGASPLDARLYFGALTVAIVENKDLELEIIAQVFGGFKVRSVTRLKSIADAQSHLANDVPQLVVVGTAKAGDSGPDEYDLIRWIRRSRVEALRTVAVIHLAGHTLQTNVERARDCGANFVVAKPITPRTLYSRIMWLAKDPRPFIDVESYCGPDRRFQKLGPPAGMAGRRHDDLSLKVGEAKEPNLSQAEIDALLSGKGAIKL
jgi:DNA-binding response OmpR family regulator